MCSQKLAFIRVYVSGEIVSSCRRQLLVYKCYAVLFLIYMYIHVFTDVLVHGVKDSP